MRIDILTLFPEMFNGIFSSSIIKRAENKGLVEINIVNLRQYSKDKHKKADDRPFGGGAGMVMTPQPVFDAVEDLAGKKSKIILLCPQGELYNQKHAENFKKFSHIILICGHYEGIDERVRIHLADIEISIGDYILTGGEIPAMIIADSVIRLMPGVLGNGESIKNESFSGKILEYPQYTRPENFRGLKVPEILLSGNHKCIKNWRKEQSLKRTKKKRPELLD